MLVPVSSTVIPLPVYKVGFSLGAAKHGDRERAGAAAGADRPEEPIKLITGEHLLYSVTCKVEISSVA